MILKIYAGMATKLRAGKKKKRKERKKERKKRELVFLTAGRDKESFCSLNDRDRLWGPPTASYSIGIGSSFSRGTATGRMKLTSHLYLQPSLRMSGVLSPLLLLLSWCAQG
jgi:hypothetical protein